MENRENVFVNFGGETPVLTGELIMKVARGERLAIAQVLGIYESYIVSRCTALVDGEPVLNEGMARAVRRRVFNKLAGYGSDDPEWDEMYSD
ncbi:MAG: helix-turn-helix domain-containing protein [Oscillospiraceae bacterium]|jgi:hypothetical protein|nr:helix-turn-helix domain-containing protein [Oscillospiraceae bacterium]